MKYLSLLICLALAVACKKQDSDLEGIVGIQASAHLGLNGNPLSELATWFDKFTSGVQSKNSNYSVPVRRIELSGKSAYKSAFMSFVRYEKKRQNDFMRAIDTSNASLMKALLRLEVIEMGELVRAMISPRVYKNSSNRSYQLRQYRYPFARLVAMRSSNDLLDPYAEEYFVRVLKGGKSFASIMSNLGRSKKAYYDALVKHYLSSNQSERKKRWQELRAQNLNNIKMLNALAARVSGSGFNLTDSSINGELSGPPAAFMRFMTSSQDEEVAESAKSPQAPQLSIDEDDAEEITDQDEKNLENKELEGEANLGDGGGLGPQPQPQPDNPPPGGGNGVCPSYHPNPIQCPTGLVCTQSPMSAADVCGGLVSPDVGPKPGEFPQNDVLPEPSNPVQPNNEEQPGGAVIPNGDSTPQGGDSNSNDPTTEFFQLTNSAVNLSEPRINCKNLTGASLVFCHRYSPGLDSIDTLLKGSGKGGFFLTNNDPFNVNSSNGSSNDSNNSQNNDSSNDSSKEDTDGKDEKARDVGANLKLIKEHASKILDQGQEGACTAFGATHVVQAFLNKKHNDPSLELNARDLWNTYNQAYMHEAAAAVKKFTFRTADGKEAKVSAINKLDNVADMIAAIDRKEAIWMASAVGPSWMRANNGGGGGGNSVLDCEIQGGAGHAYSIQGYVNHKSKGMLLVIKNSWGKRFGDGGYGYLPAKCCENTAMRCEAYTFKMD